ncbi:methionine synthase [Spirochaetia bacterium]|nr:methionine synthase [Spirochaetia bacterium]
MYYLDNIASERILVIDGAMGSLIQQLHFDEKAYRGTRFAGWSRQLSGCAEVLCLSNPDSITNIHERYLKAGADLTKTCSFNANAVSLADYGLETYAYEISYAAAHLARDAADRFSSPDRPRFVAGSMGPTAKSTSISPDMGDPGARSISFDTLELAYYDNARGLLDGGADIFLVETIFDTLNAKAAIAALARIQEERGIKVPVMLSATIASAASDRLLAGQTLEAFLVSILHADPWAVGLNCSFGPEYLKPFIKIISKTAPCLISVHPNAGLPNQLGAYDESPESFANSLEGYMRETLVNIVGGCCGTTPDHIALLARKAAHYQPRSKKGDRPHALSGWEALPLDAGFVNIGERTNVAGSKQFLRLIREEKYPEAIAFGRKQLEQGAAMLDVCMDDSLIEPEPAMTRFLCLAQSDPAFAKAPVMVDSSHWSVIESALKILPGKSLVNSISLKDGDTEFVRRLQLVHRYGAMVVVMLCDESGQAVGYDRKIAIAARAYHLIQESGFPVADVVFDPGVLALGTGIPKHDSSAVDVISACQWIHEHCPETHLVGGISNLSFSFRGKNQIRAALHSVFLQHAVPAGMTMAIVNPAVPYDSLDPALRDVCEDLILCRDPHAADRLVEMGSRSDPIETISLQHNEISRSVPIEERIRNAVIHGNDDSLESDIRAATFAYENPLDLVETMLLPAMAVVGERFEKGTLFLPQVIRSAWVMKTAVAILESLAHRPADGKGLLLLATVKGDVHDIGKNIVATVLGCSGYRILDLGVMIPAEHIIETALHENVLMIGLSGLVSPSLDEMITVAREMEKRGIQIPLLIGGAATSLAHTALRIVPEYSGPVVYVPDAAHAVTVVRALLSEQERPHFLEKLDQNYESARIRHKKIISRKRLSLEEARANKVRIDWNQCRPPEPKQKDLIVLDDYPLEKVIPYIDWESFARQWDIHGTGTEHFISDAQNLMNRIVSEQLLKLQGIIGFFPAHSENEDVIVFDSGSLSPRVRFSFPRNCEQKAAGAYNPCLADFFAPDSDWIGFFVLSARGDTEDLFISSAANALVEGFSEEIHRQVQHEWWGYGEGGIRPAFGYPACPRHQDKKLVFDLLQIPESWGLSLTESGMIIPAASVCGIYIGNRSAYYFNSGTDLCI